MSLNAPPYLAVYGFVQMYNRFAPRQAIANLYTEMECFHHNMHYYPLSRNEEEYDNSYICSFYGAYIDYAREELDLIPSAWQRWLLHKASYLAGSWLKMAQINQSVCLNNWLFSTNPMCELPSEDLQEITQKLVHQNPFYNLSIRSLNEQHNAKLIQTLKQQGWLLLPARQVYLFSKDGDWPKRNNVKNDFRLLRKTELTLLNPSEHNREHFDEIEACFKQLFIEKHSSLNPQFSAPYLFELHRQHLLEFFSFCDADGKILATLGVFTHNGIMTAPIVGYDTTAPKNLGLYRLAIAQLLKLAQERNMDVNLSSGAAQFKRNRGGTPIIEYSAIYCRHLTFKQRWMLEQFSRVLNRYAPQFLQDNAL
ncbi:GNAT family N-acetyltransferase [Thiomicrorhabdus sp. 6S2-11]|jgi:hypothetical protein|uniref:GNAT family N-acetyltransferase n=1 Tax=Thiomicrorhabdus marina TaxID=2818442 RepID=A0ABS3Q3M9_9GAMM|nr:GNAT family N-acetyltransferase [Thiomicrorhabdus marina]MBO1926440.1 GNAT family N-acetyltransferase [Thiomicrorhabdus marina]